MSISLKPLGDRVVVEPIEAEEVTASGLVLPETKEKHGKKIIAAGPGARDDDGKRSGWTSTSATWCCSPSTPAPSSRSTARSS